MRVLGLSCQRRSPPGHGGGVGVGCDDVCLYHVLPLPLPLLLLLQLPLQLLLPLPLQLQLPLPLQLPLLLLLPLPLQLLLPLPLQLQLLLPLQLLLQLLLPLPLQLPLPLLYFCLSPLIASPHRKPQCSDSAHRGHRGASVHPSMPCQRRRQFRRQLPDPSAGRTYH